MNTIVHSAAAHQKDCRAVKTTLFSQLYFENKGLTYLSALMHLGSAYVFLVVVANRLECEDMESINGEKPYELTFKHAP